MELGIISNGRVLMPMDEFQADELATLPKNVPISVVIDTSRNVQNHRRYFAFLNTALNMQEHYQNINQLRFALLIKAGYCESVTSHKTGAVSFIPMSLKFDKMGEEKFREVFKNSINAFHAMLTELNITITENDLYQLMEFE